MRKADAYELLSLHGVAEGPSEFIADFDDVMRNNLGRVIASQDVVILGRPTYDEWSEYWPTSTARRSTLSPRRTRRPPGPTPRPSTVTFSTFSRNRRFGGDIGIHGSIALTKSLLVNWLVDELQLVVQRCITRPKALRRRNTDEAAVLMDSVISPSGSLLQAKE